MRSLAAHRWTLSLVLVALLASRGGAGGGEPMTWWTGESEGGAWSDATWSAGPPTAEMIAEIGGGAAVDVLELGSACLDLRLATPSADGAVRVEGGDLEVVRELRIGDPARSGSYSQSASGTASIGRLSLVGGSSFRTHGSTAIDSCRITSGTFTIHETGEVTVATNLIVEPGFAYLAVSGALSVGTLPEHHTTVHGGFSIGPKGSTAEVTNLTLSNDLAFMSAFVSSAGAGRIEVDGTLTLNGLFFVIDPDGDAPGGRHDVAIAGAIVGTFDKVELPDGDWTWGVDGNTLFVHKGPLSPTATTSWGGVKQAFTD